MLKWKLMLGTLPYVGLVLAVVLMRDYLFHLPGLFDFSDVSPLLSAVSLIIGFMLAGVLSDFKESEKIPGEIATLLETIEDTVEVVIALNKQADVSDFRPKYQALATTVEKWFLRRADVAECYTVLDDFRTVSQTMHAAAGVNYTIRCLGETHNLRRLITRADVISQTSFLQSGYALLDLLAGTTIMLLLLANYKSPIAEYMLIGLFSLIYIYLVRLIRDIDDPFEYDPAGGATGAAEVTPYPLVDYIKRLKGK